MCDQSHRFVTVYVPKLRVEWVSHTTPTFIVAIIYPNIRLFIEVFINNFFSIPFSRPFPLEVCGDLVGADLMSAPKNPWLPEKGRRFLRNTNDSYVTEVTLRGVTRPSSILL